MAYNQENTSSLKIEIMGPVSIFFSSFFVTDENFLRGPKEDTKWETEKKLNDILSLFYAKINMNLRLLFLHTQPASVSFASHVGKDVLHRC